MEGTKINTNQITIEKFSEIFVDFSFDEEQFYNLVRDKKSLLLKPLIIKSSQTIYFEYDSEICKLPNIVTKSRDIKEVNWNKKIIELEEKDNCDLGYTDSKAKRSKLLLPSNSDFCIIYKAYKNIPECLTIPLEKNGIVRTKSFLLANLIWKLLKYDKMSILIEKLNEYQRYNHFPCTWELGRKDNLWKNFFRMKQIFHDDFKFIPETFILPENLENFLQAYEEQKGNMWIIKPVASSRGRGIKLLNNISNIPKKCLISKYISNPYLIQKKKFDLRLYVLITSYNPLKIYLYDEGLVRFASEEYDCSYINTAIIKDDNQSQESNENGNDKEKSQESYSKFMHLTNYSVNKSSNNFNKNVSTFDECVGSKWSLTALRNHFREKNLDFELLWSKIKDIVVKAIILNADQTISEVRKLTDKRNNLFEMYGFDIMIDSEINPWLLEVNLNPSLNCDTELDIKIKTSLMTDILNIIGLIPYSHKEKKIFVNKKVIDPKKLEDEIRYYENLYKNDNHFNENKNLNINEKNIQNDIKTNVIIKKDILNMIDNRIYNDKNTPKNINRNSVKTKIEDIKKEYSEIRLNLNLTKYFENYPFDKHIEDIMNYTNEEFSRKKNFNLLFPLKHNFEYYSQFILNPEIENIILWNLLKDNYIKN